MFSELIKLSGTKKNRITAYHPQANGIIEGWHRTLKDAIKCHANNRWVESLPLVLLGLRSVILPNLNASVSEMVNGSTIRLPYHFFNNTEANTTKDPFTFVERLKRQMDNIQPVPASNHQKQKIFIFKHLSTCSHAFVRKDGYKKPLQPNYDGPYEILKRDNKFFTLKIKNKDKVISIDRLKPCFELSDSISVNSFHKQPIKKVTFSLENLVTIYN